MLYNILKLRIICLGIWIRDLCDLSDLKTEKLFASYLLMTSNHFHNILRLFDA